MHFKLISKTYGHTGWSNWFFYMNSSSTRIGAFEAKTKLGELLDRVTHGGSFTITKHDRPVARLIGFQADLSTQRAQATAALRGLRGRYVLQGLDARSLREEGRA